MREEIKVSELPETTQVDENDIIMIIQNGVNKKVTRKNLEASESKKVKKIEKVSIQDSTDTYKVTYTDGSTENYQFVNGEVTQLELDEVIDELNTVKAENAYLNTVIEQAFDEISGTGENVTLENTIEARFKKPPLPGGRSRQKTRSGKNILDINASGSYASNSKIIERSDSKIVVEKGLNTTGTSRFVIPITLETNTDYIVTGKVKVLNNSSSSYCAINIRETDAGGLNLGSQGIYCSLTDEQIIKLPFNSKSYTNLWLWLYIISQYNDENKTSTRVLEFTELMIRKASEADDTYELYGAMPSPEFESPIENISGDVGVTITNTEDNLFCEDILRKYAISEDDEGYKFNHDTLYKINLTPNTKFKPNTAYTAIWTGKQTTGNPRPIIVYTDGTEEALGNTTTIATTYTQYYKRSNAEKTIAYISATYGGVGEFYIKKNSVQIQEGSLSISQMADYMERVEQPMWLDLGGKNLYPGHTKGIFVNFLNGKESTNELAAASDYIPVDFDNNENYVISGMPEGLFNFVAVYNSDKEFLGRTNVSLNTIERILDKNSFAEGTNLHEGEIAYLRASFMKSSEAPGTLNDLDNAEIQLEVGKTVTKFEPYNPIELMEGSYLADDGVHHKRKQVVFDGSDDERWGYLLWEDANRFYIEISDAKTYISSTNNGQLCTSFAYDSDSTLTSGKEHIIGTFAQYRSTTRFYFIAEQTSVEDFKTKLQSNPITVEYETQEEWIQPYTDHQREQYEKLKKATSYKGSTHIFSTNELSPIFDVTALGRAE